MAVRILADLWLFASLILHLLSVAFTVTSLASTYWMNGLTAHFGLWRYCFEHTTTQYKEDCYQISDAVEVDPAHRTVQVFMCGGLVATVLVFLLLLGLVFMIVSKDNRKLFLFVSIVVIFVQGILLFVASAVFLSQKSTYGDMETDWSHYLAWAASATSFLTACLLVIHYALNQEAYESD